MIDTDGDIARLLAGTRRIAVVGLSPDPSRDSHHVAAYLAAAGYAVVGVNPTVSAAAGLPCYPSLDAVPGGLDMVDVFRRPDAVPGIVEEAIALGARSLWLQLGVVHAAAAAAAEAAGLAVVMDRCIMVEHRRFA